ncbi:hypothetical protein QCA50_006309 [Cerrena zonata]|uniref:Uncharacterized protein n=1 Tax=Cerrena zonata TaxID=2478898 RepID=A0AAW0GCW9_9APHY
MVHYSLTPSEIEIIVGAYPDLDQQQKQISLYTWWPTPTVWDTSGFQVGYWTRACEAWFQQTLSKIRDQTHVPLTQSQWRKQLRRYAKLVKEFQNPLHN